MKNLFIKNDFLNLTEYSNRKNAVLIDIGAALIGGLSSFVNAHIWFPEQTYYMVLALVAIDFITGVLVGHRSPVGFETRKAKKAIPTLIAYTGCMVFAHKFSVEPGLFWMPQTVLLPIVVINFTSSVKNCSLLGWLPTSIADVLYKNIDKYKNPENLNNPTNEEVINSDAELIAR